MTGKQYKNVNASFWAYEVLRKLAERNHRALTVQFDLIMERAGEAGLPPEEMPPKPAPTRKEAGLA